MRVHLETEPPVLRELVAADVDNLVELDADPDGYPSALNPRARALTGERVVLGAEIDERHYSGNGYVHAGALITLADTACGSVTLADPPDGAIGFTTVELKANHMATIDSGQITATASRRHAGRITQVWDATITATTPTGPSCCTAAP